MKKKIVFFTGAGISEESGIPTYRDKGGLWDDFDAETVADIRGWRKDRETVLAFYNKKRKELSKIEPNEAHKLLAKLEEDFEVSIITQNVDDLHERAGSSKILHLHGDLLTMRSSVDRKLIYPYDKNIEIGDKCEKESQLRPNVVWFGESLDTEILDKSLKLIMDADICVIIGTSLQVQPAASLVESTKHGCLVYLVDPNEIGTPLTPEKELFFTQFKEQATIGTQKLYEELILLFKN